MAVVHAVNDRHSKCELFVAQPYGERVSVGECGFVCIKQVENGVRSCTAMSVAKERKLLTHAHHSLCSEVGVRGQIGELLGEYSGLRLEGNCSFDQLIANGPGLTCSDGGIRLTVQSLGEQTRGANA